MTSKLRVRRLGAPINGSGGGSNATEVTTELLTFLNGVVVESVQNELQIFNQTRNDFGDLRASTVTANTSVVTPNVQFGTNGVKLNAQTGLAWFNEPDKNLGDADYFTPIATRELFLSNASIASRVLPFSDGSGNGVFVSESATLNTADLKGRRLLATSYVDSPLVTTDNLECDALQLINGGRWAVGASFPFSPVAGDRWLETSSSVPIYGWWWTWNGTYWLSPEMRRNLLFDAVGATTRLYFECDQNLDYFFNRLFAGIFVQTTNTGAAYWMATLERLNAANTSTAVGSALSTQSLAADTNHALSTSPFIHVDVSAVSARQFRVNLARVGTPGSAFGSATVVFNYARP